jgi:hypothetical protein
MMLLLRPDLVGDGWRELPAARYSMAHRLIPNYPLRNGGQGYVGHPALADPEFAKATLAVLMEEAMDLVRGLLDGTLRPSRGRSPFYTMPFFRTNFWPVAAGIGAAALAFMVARKTTPKEKISKETTPKETTPKATMPKATIQGGDA